MPDKNCKIKIGDLVKVKKSFLFPEQDVFILPYNEDSVGLVIKINNAKYVYDSDTHPLSTFGHYITVKWSGGNQTFGVDDNYIHLDDELEIISKVREK